MGVISSSSRNAVDQDAAIGLVAEELSDKGFVVAQMDKLVSQVVKVLDAIGEGSESSRLQSQVWAA